MTSNFVRTSLAAALSTSVLAASASAAPPFLLADLNTQTVPGSSSPGRVTWAAGSAIPSDFALIRTSPLAFWLTTGLPGGSRPVTGIFSSSLPIQAFTINAARTGSGRVALGLTVSGLSNALYGIDTATAQATQLLEGPNLSTTVLAAGDRIVFVYDDGVSGRELWSTDGTLAGTSLLADLVPGEVGSSPTLMTSTGALAWFTVKRSTNDPRELWVTDGTPAGTQALGPLSPTNNAPSYVAAAPLGNNIVYTARDATASTNLLYLATPAAAPAQAITAAGLAIAPGSGPFYTTGTHVVFTATANAVQHLYVSDGTSANTTSISETLLNFSSDYAVAADPAAPLGWRIYYAGGATANSTEPAVTNGTRAGTVQIAELIPGTVSASPSRFTALGTRAVFTTVSYVSESFSYTGTTYLTDGTPAGTIDLMAIAGTPERPTPIVNLNGSLLVSARDARGTELWSMSPSPAFAFVDDLDPRTTSSSSPLMAIGDAQTVVLSADNGVVLQALFRTDGTPQGTFAVAAPIGVITTPFIGCPQPLGIFGNRLTLYANNITTGDEPWSVDRTTGAASLIRDIQMGGAGSLDQNSSNNCIGWFNSVQLASRGVFVARAIGANTAYAVWSTDGAPGGAGTTQLAAFRRETSFSTPLFNFTPVGDKAFFIAPGLASETNVFDNDIWITNGVSVQRAVDLSAVSLAVPLSLTGWNNRLYFSSQSSTTGGVVRLFSVDNSATFPATPAVVPLGPDASTLNVQWSIATSRGLIFLASVPGTSPARSSLWITDGTAAGTVRLTPDAPSFQPTSFQDAGTQIFFVSRDAAHGNELWATDGTLAGTRLVADIRPGPFSSDPSILRVIGTGRVVLSAYTPAFGVELWQSDGTAFGTRRVSDIAPGAASSYPTGARVVNNRLIFGADDGTSTGRELWAWDPAPTCRCDLDSSGETTLQDVFEYLNLFFTGSADFNGDNTTTLQDLFDFLTCWFAGCA